MRNERSILRMKCHTADSWRLLTLRQINRGDRLTKFNSGFYTDDRKVKSGQYHRPIQEL